jgi:hypothetical protein
MKHIKLFEAFESEILSKTLGFIQNKSDKDAFLGVLKKICQNIDFPFSKLSDQHFEYLPFKRALEKADMTGDEPCEATSEVVFPEYVVPGAKCEGGQIERKWGSRVRKVECPVCHGTGLKTKSPRLKLLKFWFTKEGKLVATTAVDGLVKASRGGTTPGKIKSSEDFGGENEYKVSKKDLTLGEVRNLPTGTIVWLENEKGSGLAYCYQYGNTFLLQNFAEGSTPDGGDWRSIARWSWVIMSVAEFDRIDLLEPVTDDQEIDPYTWNLQVDTRRNINLIDRGIEELIKPAHFAIVLDFGKLGKSNFKPASELSSERELSRKDAIVLMKDEDIKKANIDRYIELISSRSNLADDITRVDKVAKRIIGGQNVLFSFMSSDVILDGLSQIIIEYLKYIKSVENGESGEIIETRSQYLVKVIKKFYKESLGKNKTISTNLTYIKTKLAEEGKPDLIEIVEKLEKISQDIWNNLREIKPETIEDLEILIQKINSVKEIFDLRRWSLTNLTLFLRYADASGSGFHGRIYAFGYITDNIEKINKDLVRLSGVINRLV